MLYLNHDLHSPLSLYQDRVDLVGILIHRPYAPCRSGLPQVDRTQRLASPCGLQLFSLAEAMTPFPEMPEELVEMIVREAEHEDLAPWCLVSKHYLAVAGPLLWREVTFQDDAQLIRVLSALDPVRMSRVLALDSSSR